MASNLSQEETGARTTKYIKKQERDMNSEVYVQSECTGEDYEQLHIGEKVVSATQKCTGCCNVFVTHKLHHDGCGL